MFIFFFNIICFCNSVPITIISLFRAKLYLQCEGSWSGPSGSWLGREPFMPKCTSERKHTGCVTGLKLEMSKHFAYPHICSINHDKIWISLSFKDLKFASCNCSLVVSYCLLVSKQYFTTSRHSDLCTKALWFLNEETFWGKTYQSLWNRNWELCKILDVSIFYGVVTRHDDVMEYIRKLERWYFLGLLGQISVVKSLIHLQKSKKQLYCTWRHEPCLGNWSEFGLGGLFIPCRCSLSWLVTWHKKEWAKKICLWAVEPPDLAC